MSLSPLSAPMQRALALAKSALCLTSPNPRVGCVLISPDGQVIGEGHTQAAGGPHAEVMALRDAQSKGRATQGATAYVTLEPCAHHGRTPPCTDALIQAQIGAVVVAHPDPNPLVAGQGLRRLQAAGIAVHEDKLAQDAAHELNIGFFKRMTQGSPWVRMKIAFSLDGRTALNNRKSQWITSATARADGHAWRARACAVLTGMGTVRDDDPRMDVRHVQTPRQPLRVVVDSRMQTPAQARIFEPPGQALLYAAEQHAHNPAAHAIRATGAEVAFIAAPTGKIDLQALLLDLGRRQINEVHIEAGHQLNGSFLRSGLVDELLLYQAPQFIGPGIAPADLPELQELSGALQWAFHEVERIGPDLRMLLRPAR